MSEQHEIQPSIADRAPPPVHPLYRVEERDPEERLMSKELLVFIVFRFASHRPYGPAFVEHLLLGKTFAELEASRGVAADTLRKAFKRHEREVIAACRRRFALEEN